jgi:hypothetical protein
MQQIIQQTTPQTYRFRFTDTDGTEQTPNGLATYHERTFRTYAPESAISEYGTVLVTQLCEEYVDGRWEPFMSIKKGAKALWQAQRSNRTTQRRKINPTLCTRRR